jgi:hypothetical protein
MDPNWFYSSLAQAAAAIVGVVGGFALTAVLRARETAARYRTALLRTARTVRSTASNVTDMRVPFLSWYRSDVEPHLADRVGSEVTFQTRRCLAAGSLPGGRWRIEPTDAEDFRVLAADAEEFVKLFAPAILAKVLHGSSKQREGLEARLDALRARHVEIEARWQSRSEMSPIVHEGTSRIDALRSCLGTYHRELREAEAGVIPESLVWAFTLLTVLGVAGVIVPLGLLDARPPYPSPVGALDSKGMLLAFFTAGLVGLGYFIIREIREVRGLLLIRPADLDRPEL